MGKTLGGIIGGIGSLKEARQKRRDGKSLIAQAKREQANFEAVDVSVNKFEQVKISGAGTRLATDVILQSQANALESASSAGIRGQGMIGLIQQNTDAALAVESAKLTEKENQLQILKAKEGSTIVDRQIDQKNRQEDLTISKLERGQALRSKGAAEFSVGAEAIGGSLDEAGEKIKEAAKGGGGFFDILKGALFGS